MSDFLVRTANVIANELGMNRQQLQRNRVELLQAEGRSSITIRSACRGWTVTGIGMPPQTR